VTSRSGISQDLGKRMIVIGRQLVYAFHVLSISFSPMTEKNDCAS
jgi:hypothetical protein